MTVGGHGESTSGHLDEILSGPDIEDPQQQDALQALCTLSDALLSEISPWNPRSEPSWAAKTANGYLALAFENLAHACALLQPVRRTFARANLVSHVLRSNSEIYARLLAAHVGPSVDDVLAASLAQSSSDDRKALVAAAEAGDDTEWAIGTVDETLRELPTPASSPVAALFRDHEEHEMLAVYKWESGVVHVGATYVAARRASAVIGGSELDIYLNPPSLWRIGQLTWAAFGVAQRTISLAAILAGRDLPLFTDAAASVMENVKAASLRDRPSHEPPSPTYGAFDFAIWDLGE